MSITEKMRFSCNPGYDLTDFIFCYPQCKQGYSPLSFLCWSTCNYEQARGPGTPASGTNPAVPGGLLWQDAAQTTPVLVNTGDDWHDDGAICRKRLYDRGVGTIPDACADSNRELFVGMCYTKCGAPRVATKWSPATCADPCPPNTNEGGFANCTKQNSYGRGAGNWGNGCPGGYQNWGLWCFRWENFSFSGYNCPGRCPMFPRDGNYGRSQICSSGAAASNPAAYAMKTDPAGNQYNDAGCYPDPNNAGSYLPPLEPSYYYAGDGIANSGPGRLPSWYTGSMGSPGDPIPAFDSSGNPVSGYFNSKRGPQQSSDCEENWGSLCYPKCDVGYYNFACCVCSPSCSPLRDDGATCSRGWNDRGVGKVPDACSDENKIYQELLCYAACKQNYRNFCTTCTRGGCPYAGADETPLTCSKTQYIRGGVQIALPQIGNKLNSKINIGALKDSLQRIILNAFVILFCLIAAIFIFSTNGLLRSKRVKVKGF